MNMNDLYFDIGIGFGCAFLTIALYHYWFVLPLEAKQQEAISKLAAVSANAFTYPETKSGAIYTERKS